MTAKTCLGYAGYPIPSLFGLGMIDFSDGGDKLENCTPYTICNRNA
jgi:hypothetical protein